MVSGGEEMGKKKRSGKRSKSDQANLTASYISLTASILALIAALIGLLRGS
jgi:hypothetical protein